MSFQKHITPAVLLALAAGAQAQSSLNVYGVIDLSVGSFQKSGVSGGADNKHVTKVDGNQLVTSYIGFKGVEDLGDGLKAGFVLEGFLRPDTGASGRFGSADPFWSRAANVYLQGGFGKVTAGRQINLLYANVIAYNPFVGAFGLSPAVRLTFDGSWGNDKGDSGWSNAVTYSTPNLSGFTASVSAQAGETTDKSQRESYAVLAAYTAGPFSVGGAWQTVGSAQAPKAAFAAGQRQTFGMAGASFDAGFAKFFAQYGALGNNGFSGSSRIDTKLFQLGASVPVTPMSKVMASFGQSKEKAVEGGTTPNTTHQILTVAYDYNLSKRTDTYVAYMLDNEKLANYKKGHSYVVGLRHAF